MVNHIVLIGPEAAGKSSVGECLAVQLELPRISLDLPGFYRPIFLNNGYNEEFANKLKANPTEFQRYREKFYVLVAKESLSSDSVHVIDFGAFQSVLSDNNNFEQLSRLLAPINDVFLLLPTEDIERSKQILLERKSRDYPLNEDEFLQRSDKYLRSDANKRLAKHIVYTEGRTVEQVCDSIIRIIEGRNNFLATGNAN